MNHHTNKSIEKFVENISKAKYEIHQKHETILKNTKLSKTFKFL